VEGFECINGGETCQCTALITLFEVKHQQKQHLIETICVTRSITNQNNHASVWKWVT